MREDALFLLLLLLLLLLLFFSVLWWFFLLLYVKRLIMYDAASVPFFLTDVSRATCFLIFLPSKYTMMPIVSFLCYPTIGTWSWSLFFFVLSSALPSVLCILQRRQTEQSRVHTWYLSTENELKQLSVFVLLLKNIWWIERKRYNKKKKKRRTH